MLLQSLYVPPFMKRSFPLLALLLIVQLSFCQSVKQTDRYGSPIVFEDGLVLKSKDRYGTPLYYIDGQTIKSKDRYGEPLFYIDGFTVKLGTDISASND
jgi:hypothetical protein